MLLLRGPQTSGELRSRGERLHPFASVAEVEATLAHLAERDAPLVVHLPRHPGQKERRWAHTPVRRPTRPSPGAMPGDDDPGAARRVGAAGRLRRHVGRSGGPGPTPPSRRSATPSRSRSDPVPGKPLLAYRSATRASDDGRTLHGESGFWRVVGPDDGGATRVELVVAQGSGIVEAAEGMVDATGDATDVVLASTRGDGHVQRQVGDGHRTALPGGRGHADLRPGHGRGRQAAPPPPACHAHPPWPLTASSSDRCGATGCRPGGATPSSASSSTGPRRRCRRTRRSTREIGELLARRDPHAMAWSPYAEWYENSLRFPESPVARHHAEVLRRRGDYHEFANEWEAALDGGTPTAGPSSSPPPAPATSCSSPSTTTATACGRPSVPNPRRPGFHSRRDVVGELAEAVRAQGLRFGVYYSGGLDWTFNDHAHRLVQRPARRPAPRRLPRLRRGARARADRPLPAERAVERHLVAGAGGPARRPARRVLRRGARRRGQRPLHAVVTRCGRWPSRSPAGTCSTGCRPDRPRPTRASSRPSRPCSTCAPPSTRCSTRCSPRPWECVRGIDRSFGHNRLSSEEHFLSRHELLWSLADITAKGGNLLLNVGPRGEDATIAHSPAPPARLVGRAHDEGVRRCTPPGPGCTRRARAETRRHSRRATRPATRRSSPSSAATATWSSPWPRCGPRRRRRCGASPRDPAGAELRFEPQQRGLRVTLDEPLEPGVPVALALHQVDAESTWSRWAEQLSPGLSATIGRDRPSPVRPTSPRGRASSRGRRRCSRPGTGRGTCRSPSTARG